MSLAAQIQQIQPSRRQSLAGKVRESFIDITDARARGVTWPELARTFRASKIRVTAHSLRSTYYQVAESLQAAEEVPESFREISAVIPEQSPASRSVAGSQAQDCARNVQDLCKPDASKMQDASTLTQVAGGPQERATKPSERVAVLAAQPRPAAASSLRDANGFVQNIPDDLI